MIKRALLTATVSLAALAGNAGADPISYSFTMASTDPSGEMSHWEGYFILDDALMLSHGSGTLRTYDLEFTDGHNGGFPPFLGGYSLGFGQQYGNDLNFPGQGSNPGYILHTPSPGAVITFADGVPVAIAYSEQHLLDRITWTMLSINGDGTYEVRRFAGDQRGTYAIGAQIPIVPESETWALMLAGAAAIAPFLRKREKA